MGAAPQSTWDREGRGLSTLGSPESPIQDRNWGGGMKPLEEKVTPAEVTWNLASQACARGREQGIILEGLEGQKR